jgi:hypothetical protein
MIFPAFLENFSGQGVVNCLVIMVLVWQMRG